MRWKRGVQSELIEDRRDRSESPTPAPTKGRRPVRRGRRLSKRQLIIVLAAALVIVGVRAMMGGSGEEAPAPSASRAPASSREKPVSPRPGSPQSAPGDTILSDGELKEFLAFLIEDVNAVWRERFARELKAKYQPVRMVLFEGTTRTGCGPRRARGGPAYCPVDKKMYVPPSFYRELSRELNAPGDFAQALVVAHEIGHHVQMGTGVTLEVHQRRKRRPSQARDLSIRKELQADCFAGVWAHSTARRDLLEAGDVAEALRAAAAIGDDALQEQAGRQIDESKFTHGSSAQRRRWFQKGFDEGTVAACDTFSARRL